MSIYNEPVRVLMREMISELAPLQGSRFSKHDAVNWFANRYPKIKEGTISAHLIRFSTNARTRLHYSARPNEDLLYQLDGSHFRLYEPATDPIPIHSVGDPSVSSTDPLTPGEAENSNEFAYEKDLQNFLSKNLNVIEAGLQLYQDEEISGVEFPAGGRFIDILAVDSENILVVIELKVSRGHDRVVGQLLRYMAWIAKYQAEPDQGVRGIIAAREISDDLKLACSLVANVSLYEYELSVKMKRVAMSTGSA